MNGNENTNPSGDVAADDSVNSPVETAAAVTAEPMHLDPAEVGDRVWDSLTVIKRELQAFNLIPGMLIPHVLDRSVVAKVENPRENLLAPMQILTNDVTAFRERLASIAAKHEGRVGSSVSADEQLEAIQINEEYIQWGADYETVITPNVLGMMTTLLDAGAAVNAEQLSVKPTDVIEATMAESEAEVANA